MDIEFVMNPFKTNAIALSPDVAIEYDRVSNFFRSVPGYSPTSLHNLHSVAKDLNVGEVWVKDESHRLGLPAFKILGVLYAMDVLFREEVITPHSILVCATDGNHGRALARAARQYNVTAKVYIHKGAAAARIRALIAEGAEVTIIDGTYDDSVRAAASAAHSNGWMLFSDTACPGDEVVPGLIMDGYTMLMAEADSQWRQVPDLIIVQAGVGGLAAAIVKWTTFKYIENRPLIVCCEPCAAACVLESIRMGHPTVINGSLETVMAGLSCGTVSSVAWPSLQLGVAACVTVEDRACLDAVYRLAHPGGRDPHIVSGESGACGLAALTSIVSLPGLHEVRSKLQIGPASRIMLINTEGATDPEGYRLATGIPVA